MNLTPSPIQQFFDNNGRPLSGGKLFTYAAGTTIKRTTYQDSGSGAPNTNPIILNFRGEARIWIDPTLSYKFALAPSTDTDPPTNPIWTVDNITAGPASMDNAAQDTGSPNTVRLSIPALSGTPAMFDRIVWRSAFQNTGNTSIVINGGLSKSLAWQNLANLQPKTIQSGGVYEAIYDGTVWQLQGPTLNPLEQLTVDEFVAGVTPIYYANLPGDVRRYCTDTETNHQNAFTDAVAASKYVYVPAGTWNLDHWVIDIEGIVVITDGFSSVLHQRTGNINRRLVEICASNITFCQSGVKVTGNIATDTGEQQHGVFVSGDHPTGASISITNIIIGNIWGSDLRGDVFYMGAPAGFTTTNVTAGVISGSNILRNIVSVVGASYSSIIGIRCNNACGYSTFDVEPNSGGTPSTDVSVGWIYGGNVQIAPPTAGTTARRIKIGEINLDPAFQANSTPGYTGYAAQIITGLRLRNCVDIEIGLANINNFTEYASDYTFNVGETNGQNIRIDILRGSGCGPSALNAFLEWGNVQTYTLGDVDVTLRVAAGEMLVLGQSATKLTTGTINRCNVNGTVQRFGTRCKFNQVTRNDTTDSHTFMDIDGLEVTNSNITAPRLISNVTQFQFTNVTATCTTSYIGGTCNNGKFDQSAGGLATICQGSAVYDPPNLADGTGVTTTVTATGCVLGDTVSGVSFSADLQGITLTAWVSAANTVSVRFQNETGAPLDLVSGTLRVYVRMA